MRDRAALAVLPLLFVAVLFLMRASSLPYWQLFNLDPAYYYLMNGLLLSEGLPPVDIGHPGTTVQIFVAAVLRLIHPGQSAAAVVEAALDDPEGHLVTVTTLMFPLVGVALYALGAAFRSATGRLAPALLAQSSPFLSMIIPKFSVQPKPEPFIIIASAVLMIALVRTVTTERLRDRHAVAIGAVLGFGIVTKLHFLAMGLAPLFLLDRRRLFLVLPTATLATMVLCFAPALPSLKSFLHWWGAVAVGSGAYGAGPHTVIDPHLYPHAIIGLFGSKLNFTGTILCSLAALAGYARLRRRGLLPADPWARLLAGLVAAQVFTVLLVAKQPAAHYMVPALMLTGPCMAILWLMSARVFPAPAHARAWTAVALVLVPVQAFGVWRQNAELARWTAEGTGLDMTRYAACAKVDYDSASTPVYALQRGDMDAGGRYSPLLAGRMPKDHYVWFINDHAFWSHGFMQWNRPMDVAQVVASHPCTVFRGDQPDLLLSWLRKTLPDARPQRCAVGDETLFTLGIDCR